MKTNKQPSVDKDERSVEEIVETFQHEYGQYTSLGSLSIASDWLRNTLTAERQRCEEMVEAEREIARNLYEGLQIMFEQYCPNGNHNYMTAGETAEELLDMYPYLKCDCHEASEQQEWDGHTRYCNALTHPTPLTNDKD